MRLLQYLLTHLVGSEWHFLTRTTTTIMIFVPQTLTKIFSKIFYLSTAKTNQTVPISIGVCLHFFACKNIRFSGDRSPVKMKDSLKRPLDVKLGKKISSQVSKSSKQAKCSLFKQGHSYGTFICHLSKLIQI